ncbi:cell division protein ZapC [Zophobihabitans entericus]|uniref:Cell division protein ZapC n=1 Tax=Zophobihabitans entericus TaxID=1635327 RepID=A0A6G9IAJ1_9GAMM|nr:cell division protein ZapC [Zophobihabitans entericus]QIQ21246.1 cell division protein ZapC [Zophobihabitans entericus]
MNIRPADNWRWYFDDEHNCLMLDLSNGMVFRSRYPAKMLTVDAFNTFSFSVDDATAYYQFYESCAKLPISEPLRVELVLNALIARNYLKPQMPKSWYFVQQPMVFQPKIGELVEASVQDTGERIDLLAVDVGDSATLCLITKPSLFMAGKQFGLADAVKVMHDRLASKNHLHYMQRDDNDGPDELLLDFLCKVC